MKNKKFEKIIITKNLKIFGSKKSKMKILKNIKNF